MQKIIPANASLIPESAQKVFGGRIFDVYQWEQKQFDDSYKTFEMLKRPDTVQVIIVKGPQILLVEDEQPGQPPRLHFPGGRVDEKDVTWQQATEREVREETGLVCASWKLIDVRQPLIKIEWFTPIFLATDISAEHEQQLDPGGERITVQWHEFDDVRERVLSGNEQMMQYLVPFFNRVTTLKELLVLSEYLGNAVDR